MKLARYRVTLEAKAPLQLPAYLGSTLRGAFGHAFRRVACVPGPVGECLQPESCPYHLVFETSPTPGAQVLRSFDDVPRPFVIAPPVSEAREYPAGSDVAFDLTLIGRAREFFPWLVVALREVSAVGRGRGAVALKRLDVDHPLTGPGPIVFDAADGLVRSHDSMVSFAECDGHAAPTRATIRFRTWTRLKHEGAWAQRPDFHVLFRRLLGRLSSLSVFHCGRALDVDFRGLIDRARQVRLVANGTRWRTWSRYSSRQDQRMELGGLIGEAVYEGDLTPFWPFLVFGQWTHVGKNATFGLGRYEIVGHDEEVE